jgi:arsenite-transporting ATPase
MMNENGGILVFAGKGGVGKTTCAAVTALHHAETGKRTLCISTDPTPSLSHIFDIEGERKPLQVGPMLDVNELGMDEISEMWDRKFGREVYEVFSSFINITYPEFTEFMVSILPGLRDEFMVDYVRELKLGRKYEIIVWDTAPLGQTLALLRTPAMLAEHLRLAPRIYSRIRVGARTREPIMGIIKRWQGLSTLNMDFLQKDVKFTLVTIAEALAVKQLESIRREIDKFGIRVQQIIVNNVIQTDGSDFLSIRANRQEGYLTEIRHQFAALPIVRLPLVSFEIKGLTNIRKMADLLFHQGRAIG